MVVETTGGFAALAVIPDSKKLEVESLVRKVGQQKAANKLKVSRSTLRDYLYRHKLATRMDGKQIPEKDIDQALLEVAALVN
jgi:predicted DNA-binding protein (UPF0251 family)